MIKTFVFLDDEDYLDLMSGLDYVQTLRGNEIEELEAGEKSVDDITVISPEHVKKAEEIRREEREYRGLSFDTLVTCSQIDLLKREHLKLPKHNEVKPKVREKLVLKKTTPKTSRAKKAEEYLNSKKKDKKVAKEKAKQLSLHDKFQLYLKNK